MPKIRVSPPNEIWFETNLDVERTLGAIKSSTQIGAFDEKPKGYCQLELIGFGEKEGLHYIVQIYYPSKKIKIFYPNIETLERMYKILSTITLKSNGEKADWILIKDQMDKLASEIKAFFKLFWGKNVVKIEKHDFFEMIQRPIKDHLNGDLTSGEFFDPILDLNIFNANCLLEDARLARKNGHFLTSNHRDVLAIIDKVSEAELISHNVRWARKFESEFIEGEDEPGAEFWRFDLSSTVTHELMKRRKVISEECLSYYQRFDRFEISLHDVFEEDKRWDVDITAARVNYRQRRAHKALFKYS